MIKVNGHPLAECGECTECGASCPTLYNDTCGVCYDVRSQSVFGLDEFGYDIYDWQEAGALEDATRILKGVNGRRAVNRISQAYAC